MAYELDQSTDNSVLFDDVVVRYPKGLADIGAEGVANAIARQTLTARVTENEDSIDAVAEQATRLESRADDADTERAGQSEALQSLQTTTQQQGESINTLSGDVVDLSSRIGETEEQQGATSDALDALETRANQQGKALSTQAARSTDLQSSLGAVNLVLPPGRTPSPATSAVVNARATQALTTRVEQTEEKLSAQSELVTELESSLSGLTDQSDATARGLQTLTTSVQQQGRDVEAQATQLSQIETVVGENSAAVQSTAETVDGISAQQVFKVGANGVTAGLGLASGPAGPDGVTQSRIYLAAETIGFVTDPGADPSTAKSILVAQGNDVVINSALIGQAQITDAMIESLGANKITADSLSAISANMGTLTAGTYKTRETGQRLEISSQGIPFWFGDGAKSVGNALTCIEADGTFHSRSATSGARLEYDDDHISVFDENGRERVRMGRIS